MKIGLVRRGYSSTGGAEKYLLRLAAELMREGHHLALYSDQEWPEQAFAELDRSPESVVIEGRDPEIFARNLRDRLLVEPCEFLLSLERVLACDAYRAGDGVHAAWLERRAKFEPRWKRMVRGLNRKHRALIELETALFRDRGAQRVIANSQMVRMEIVERYDYPADQIDVVYNGLPPLVIEPGTRAAVRAELEIDPDRYVAIFVGSGWERKGLAFAMEAIQAVPEAVLLVAGKGKAKPQNNVRFLGPRQDIPRLLAAADAFILPTIYDPFSNASLEALSAGLPVITTRANGCAEIIETGVHGTVVDEPNDIAALADGLRFWSDATVRVPTRETRVAKAADFSIERNLRETMAVLEQTSRV